VRAPAAPELRLADPDDLESLRLLVAAFRDHLKADAPTDRELAAHLPVALADPAIEFACAWLEGSAVGYSQTRFYFSVWSAGIEALLEDLFVLPGARGREVGRALLRHALGRARERGARLLVLNTNERNEAAQALYRSEGLRPQAAKLWGGGREIRWAAELGDA
jgi:ribosomal protein S18 acetylase RimI-like enzyme